MFLGNGRRPQHSHSPNASEANVNQVIPYGWPGRHMGPPQLNHPPQPVEIDPVSYPRTPGSYTPWEGTTYSIGYIVEPNPSLSSSLGHVKAGPTALDFGTRNSPPDPLTSWYNGNDGPWIPKGAVPEVSPDERIQPRMYPPYRHPGYGSPPGNRHRPGNPSDNGSVPFGISPSDSGYGTGISLESASVRGSDIVDHSHDNRSLLGRVPETHQYNESGSSRESHRTEQWTYNSPSTPLYHCQTCKKQVKTKSELKYVTQWRSDPGSKYHRKHHLRHTKPHHCTNTNCHRTEGFSTVNDLNRHRQSKHPGDLSGEMHTKTYHCLVLGCKSQGKIWPRLDNFKSHLKRMHHLQEDAMDHFVHRGEMGQGTKGSLPSQGTSSESPGRLDQDIPLGLGSDDFPELSYPGEHPQWGPVSPSSLDRQAEITDPLLENTDAQSLVPPNGAIPVGLQDSPGKPMSLEGSRALWEPDAGNGCLEKEKKLLSSDATGESVAMPITDSLGSLVGTPECSDMLVRGKMPKQKKAPTIDPCLRDAITAVLSTPNPGQDNGSDQGYKSLPGVGSPDVGHVSEISPCRIDSGIALPSLAATSGRHPDDQDPCLNASSASSSDKSDLTDQDVILQRLLQAIKDAGYVLKKDGKSQAGLGQNVNNLGSGLNKKRDLLLCSICKFRGRPCELKKHMKRHTRPYACTFPKCLKIFGSKNDWRRHETSQHYQHETWRCDEKTNGASCTKVFFSADIARAHLTKIHKVTDPEATEKKIDARRIGPNNQARFWCGFCEKIVDLTQKGVDAWTERFNHIDEHFMGKNGRTKQSIAQWKAANSDGEGAQQNVSVQPQSPNDGSDRETSDDSSPSSSDTSSASPDTSIMPPSPDAAQSPQKRKRADSDERGGRSKQPRHGKSELRILCCECGFELNPRIDTTCPSGHEVCNGCERRQVGVLRDD